MLQFAGKLEEHAEELATLESEDVGKTAAEAAGDIAFATMLLRFYAGKVNTIHGKAFARDSHGIY